MSNNIQEFNTTLPYEQTIKVENNFNYNVASLGDIYSPYLKKKKQNQDIEYNTILPKGAKPSSAFRRYNRNILRDTDELPNSFNKSLINTVNLGESIFKNYKPPSKDDYDINKDPAQKNRKIYVNYLHQTPLGESKKFSHVVQGKINPVKSNFSCKKIIETNIKNHEDSMRPIVLYPSHVNIHNIEPEKILPGTLRRSQENFNNNNNTNSLMVIGQGFDPRKENRDLHVSFTKPKETKFQRKVISSQSARKTLEVGEKFVGAVDDYFMSSSMKIPSKNKITDIVKFAENLEKSLNNFENEISGKKKTNKKINAYFDAPFLKTTHKIINPRPPKVYPEIDGSYEKKVEEKLASMQIELRQILDNITRIRESSPNDVKKIKELIGKAKELTHLMKHLAEDVKKGEKEFRESMKKTKKSEKNKNFVDTNSSVNLSQTNRSNNNLTLSNSYNNNNNTKLKSSFKRPLSSTNRTNNNFYKGTKTNFNPIVEDLNEDKYSNKLSKNTFNLNNSMNKTQMTSQNNNNNNYYNNTQNTLSNYNPMISSTLRSTNSQYNNPNNLNQSGNSFTQSINPSMKNSMAFTNTFSNTNNINNNNNNYNTLNQTNFNPIKTPTMTNYNQTNFNPYQTTYTGSNPLIMELAKSQPVNDMSQTINHYPIPAANIKVDTKVPIYDDRFSSYKVEFPAKYYYEVTKENEPPRDKDWYIRPHHTETFVHSDQAIADDVLNTKYISYYGTEDKSNKPKSRQEILEELISETRGKINELQNQMNNNGNNSEKGKELLNRLEDIKKEALKSYEPGQIIDKEKKKKNIENMLKDPNQKEGISAMFEGNDEIHQTNLTIEAYGKMLEELRNKEREILIEKRKKEYERIRPPKKNWYELKGEEFIEEMCRNKMVINAGPEYFEKIEALNNDDLY